MSQRLCSNAPLNAIFICCVSYQQVQVKNCAAIECYFIAVAHEFVWYNQLAQAAEIKSY